MYERTARAVFAILVVIVHVVFVSFCAVYLQARITKFATYVSTIAVFLPVFGIYVGVVVKSVGISKGPRGRKVSGVFLALMVILFAAYVAGNAFVLWSYETGFIGTEDLLPAAVALVESAFGGFFTTLFLTLFGQEAPEKGART
ncbi:hypothetical protein JF540_13455 [Salipiger thiooxidans]|uniref:hypothetical protein n=1 Tax=Salipiger thiooxidans TaxID=282683 RepID=UPI001A8F4593|nr:hypothetical protein [Salipiger thiooxidans]MBN8187697.1 hypothetical protein [Salipiger thiooxidans]